MIAGNCKNFKNIGLEYQLLMVFLFLISPASAQYAPSTNLNSIISTVNTFNSHLAIEKLYLHTDKPSYLVGDTLWFKGYLFNAAHTNAALKSGLLYVEIANDSNQVVKRMMVQVYRGLTFGQILLDEELHQGGYTLRAYTNRMRNFGEDYVFKKQFYLSNARTTDWLIKYHTDIVNESGKDNLKLGLEINRFDRMPVGLREMNIKMTDGKRTLYNRNAATNPDGLLEIKLDLPERLGAGNLILNMQDLRKGEGNRILEVPISANRPQHTDLQFMPEGGNLVAGLPAHIAFKALSEDGRGTDVSGKIYNSKNQEVAEFQSSHKGIGSFHLLPQPGESYSARIKLPDGSEKNYPLPMVQPSGITLQVVSPVDRDSCMIIISASPGISAADTYFLVGQARGAVCYGAAFTFKNGPAKIIVAKNTFPSGITRFTVTGPDKTALCERIIFLDHHDNLKIQLSTNKDQYKKRDSAAVTVRVTDKDGNPVRGSFSLAVTDDGQVKTDSLADETIITRMLLTGDLKGTIEDPGYYINATENPSKHRYLDQLLLAQGWVGYDWKDVFSPLQPLAYAAEQEFLIKGRVLNMLNKPVSGSGVTLLSKKPLLVRDTVSNDQGKFTFKGLTPSDTTVFFLQSKNKRDKSFNVGIEMDELKPPVFSTPNLRILPWYVNMDTAQRMLVNKQVELKQARDLKLTGGRALKEVVIKAKKIIKDSKNLNGPGEADVIIDQEKIEKAGKKTLGDLIRENIDKFGTRTKYNRTFYFIDGMFAHLIIDGTIIWSTLSEGTSLYEHFKYYLDYYEAEDIKGIEVMMTGKYQPGYSSRYLSPKAKYWEHAFIEITTRSGHGPYLKKSPGTFLYKPLPFILPKTYYSPKYISTSISDGTDIRSTIHWEPNVITDKEGKAALTFYTADYPGIYSIVIEGADMRGNLGVRRAQVKVDK